MRKIHFKFRWKSGVALIVASFLCLGLSRGAVLAQKAPKNRPANQREFDAVAARLNGGERDSLGHAFGNEAARLFWFTDIEKAKAQAKIERKPILSLRLLGNLTDEYSCANSRFFRVIFYPQSQINALLREKFVLHWSRERPVPIVTIDMGDGRVIKRTLTGNSVHYLLDFGGRPLDVMPGVVTPAHFQNWLEKGAQLNAQWTQTPLENREAFLSGWHRAQMAQAWRELNPNQTKDEKWLATELERSIQLNPLEKSASARTDAAVAAPLSVSKVLAEAPILDATRLFGSGARVGPVWLIFDTQAQAGGGAPLPAILDDQTRAKIKAMRPFLAAQDNSVPGVGENWTAQAQMRPVGSENAAKNNAIAPFEALIATFEASISTDDRMSLARFQIPIHASFALGNAGDFESLNRKIYDRLFLTPKSDPWLGLSSDGIFTGLQNGGVFKAGKEINH